MEYETHKRTKNLTLRDIHVGDWVQEWSPLTGRYDPPTKVMSISDDGDVLLIYDDKHRLTPNEARIENIDALPIDADLLRGFRFEKNGNFYSFRNTVFAVDSQLDVMDFSCIDKYGKTIELEDIAYMHELQQALHEERNFIGTFKPEWKGVEKMSKELFCGECDKFLYEDACGYGVCDKTNEECYCGDKCHINHGKP